MTDEQQKQQRHKSRQQRLKAEVDKAIAHATDEKGLLLVITGNGKGKSTSGFGTVARAVGHGMRAAVAQFIKGSWDCGERNLLQQHGVTFAVMATGFTWDTQDKAADIAAAEQVWQQAEQYLADTSIDLVLLDELTYMLSYHYIAVERVERALLQRPAQQHVVITGRACHRRIIELADTVSEVQNVKHAFDNGIKAQRGLDW
ncbi:cob(I)yrinic acid a,c-diamide adenosyltransferase [Rheinheimera muenzenbergensis]|jgi:cob(I)alamin adenosyltransferase|uniref:Corrinoid adenosyltransferase n=1 Tax=Rheinheimera muenzenbergensis TaxID=1193628 RepID=A0ABU8C6T9_9GAMM|nr:cob(I)yrinic acid a,c-diamide adenosyltransferase [Gammaproteobacteria bacterium]MBU1556999.1 cob(I)yrinic acid a,c-diamide adenosyltransferase [Gammaproteobacteria bacterium]MBU2069538.1 cob(I)yrinic acid a,c-diamide adenosyltransferase [Gammaproteobacteria bacterium]MBU2183084.1 cob(I)yrinic acid a,c-diamide adenosyltransferase [Gammaproteobacteria bacterium]MBU2203088.1 cob(I)yrinic acid a,c-diamide adenosyltransferase [Gammaproteobacteria bacterium]